MECWACGTSSPVMYKSDYCNTCGFAVLGGCGLEQWMEWGETGGPKKVCLGFKVDMDSLEMGWDMERRELEGGKVRACLEVLEG